MKLLHCTRCGDIVRLYPEWRSCACQRSRARYTTDTHVHLVGPCRAIGIDTKEFGARAGTWAESARVVRT